MIALHSVNHIVRPGETIASTAYERRTGGKGANQAVAVARAGGRVVLDGRVGRDGKNVVKEIYDHGVDVSGVEIVAASTSSSQKISQQLNPRNRHQRVVPSSNLPKMERIV